MRLPTIGIRNRLREVLDTREYHIPENQGFEGTGAPGLYLEHLLGLKTSNVDVPDAGAWEVKYTSGTAPITLFHKDPYPRRQAIRYIINHWGWIGKNGRPSFRYTLWGESDRFHVVDDANSIWVRRTGYDDVSPHWSHDDLITAFARKMSNLMHVRGSYSPTRRVVKYESAELLSRARASQFVRAVTTGLVAIDFDAYIRETGAVRNHGTKFRVRPADLHSLYTDRQAFG